MFENKIIVDEITVFLTGIQPNVDWNEFFNKYLSKTDIQILSRLRPLLWSDKDIERDYTMTNSYYFDYYTKLLNKIPDLDDYDIYIIDTNEDSLLDYYFTLMINHKISVLTRLLALKRLKYKLIRLSDINDQISGFIFPTGSITYPVSEIILPRNGLLIDDGYYNIYSTENEKKTNQIKIYILSLINTSLSPEEILDPKLKYTQLRLFSKT